MLQAIVRSVLCLVVLGLLVDGPLQAQCEEARIAPAGLGDAWTDTLLAGGPASGNIILVDIDGDDDLDYVVPDGSSQVIFWGADVDGDGSIWMDQAIDGSFRVEFVWATGIPDDAPLQFWTPDPLGPANFSATNGVEFRTPTPFVPPVAPPPPGAPVGSGVQLLDPGAQQQLP